MAVVQIPNVQVTWESINRYITNWEQNYGSITAPHRLRQNEKAYFFVSRSLSNAKTERQLFTNKPSDPALAGRARNRVPTSDD